MRQIYFPTALILIIFVGLALIRDMNKFTYVAANDCISGSRRCEPGMVNIAGLPGDEYWRTPPDVRGKLYNQQKEKFKERCINSEVRSINQSVSISSFRLYFECRAGSHVYVIVVDGASVFNMKVFGMNYAFLPGYRTRWGRCVVEHCPDNLVQLLQIDPGG